MIVDEFIQWLSTAGPEDRAMAAAPLVRACLNDKVAPDLREGLEAIMMVFLDDPEPQVRAALAVALAAEPAAPHPVVLALAQDVPDIAAAIVARSPVLIDAELVDLVAVGTPEIQIAAANRTVVGPGLAAALAEVAEPPALAALLRNLRAAIPHFSLRRMVERAAGDAEVRAAILARPGVPIDVRQSLLLEMSAAYHDQILARSDMREDRAEMITRDAKDKATIALAAGAADHEMRPLVEHLRATGQLTTTLMLRAACMGNIAFVREALALLTGQPSGRVTALIADGREAAIRALYRKSGMPDRVWPVFRAAIEVNRDLAGIPDLDDQRFARMVIDRVIDEAGGGPGLDDLVVLLRRFATEAARDAARSYVARTLARPAALAAPAETAAEDLDAADFADIEVAEAADADMMDADLDPGIDVAAAIVDAVAARYAAAGSGEILYAAEEDLSAADAVIAAVAETDPLPALDDLQDPETDDVPTQMPARAADAGAPSGPATAATPVPALDESVFEAALWEAVWDGKPGPGTPEPAAPLRPAAGTRPDGYARAA